VSQSHAIYYFGKCVIVSRDCDTYLGNKILRSVAFLK